MTTDDMAREAAETLFDLGWIKIPRRERADIVAGVAAIIRSALAAETEGLRAAVKKLADATVPMRDHFEHQLELMSGREGAVTNSLRERYRKVIRGLDAARKELGV